MIRTRIRPLVAHLYRRPVRLARRMRRRWASRKLGFINAGGLPCHVSRREELTGRHPRLPAIWHALEGERFRVEEIPVDGSKGGSVGSLGEGRLHLEYDTVPGFFLRFEEAIVFPKWGIAMPGPRTFLRESTPAAAWFSPTFKGVPGVVQARSGVRILPRRPSEIVEGTHLLLAHWGGHNYGHWLLDCLPGAVMLLPELRRGELRLLSPPLLDWQMRVTDLLGITRSISQVDAEEVRCTDLIFSSLHTGDHRLKPHALAMTGFAEGRILQAQFQAMNSYPKQDPPFLASYLVRNTFQAIASAVVDRSGPAPQFIYVTRKSLEPGRVMTNEKELVTELERRGFAVVDPAEMTIDQQVSVFSDARVIVGPVGAGLTNMGFAPTGCGVVEILPARYSDGWNLHLAGVLGHRYAYVQAEMDESRITPVEVGGRVRRNLFFEYEAPLRRVLEVIERILVTVS